jgi:hypothetical protein
MVIANHSANVFNALTVAATVLASIAAVTGTFVTGWLFREREEDFLHRWFWWLRRRHVSADEGSAQAAAHDHPQENDHEL